MNKSIWKFPLKIQQYQTIEAPGKLDPIKVMLQNGEPHIWGYVTPGLKPRKVNIRVVATGEEFDLQKHIYVDTFQHGIYVWHVFVALYDGEL